MSEGQHLALQVGGEEVGPFGDPGDDGLLGGTSVQAQIAHQAASPDALRMETSSASHAGAGLDVNVIVSDSCSRAHVDVKDCGKHKHTGQTAACFALT